MIKPKPWRWTKYRKALRTLMQSGAKPEVLKEQMRDRVFEREQITQLTLETPNAAAIVAEIGNYTREIDAVAERLGMGEQV